MDDVQAFIQTMNVREKAAGLFFVEVMKNFLGNKKELNYKDFAGKVFSAFHDSGCKMNIKMRLCPVIWTNFG